MAVCVAVYSWRLETWRWQWNIPWKWRFYLGAWTVADVDQEPWWVMHGLLSSFILTKFTIHTKHPFTYFYVAPFPTCGRFNTDHVNFSINVRCTVAVGDPSLIPCKICASHWWQWCHLAKIALLLHRTFLFYRWLRPGCQYCIIIAP